MRPILILLLVAALADHACAAGVIQWGRNLPALRDDRFHFTAGTILEMEAMVPETTRSQFNPADGTWAQVDALPDGESDLTMQGAHPLAGFSYDYAAWISSIRLDVQATSASEDAEARRNYYIGVGQGIDFEGQSYDQLKIPAGSSFSVDLSGALVELVTPFHPVSIQLGSHFKMVPSLDLGVLAYVGEYEIDAGDPTSIESSPELQKDYVVGGQSSWMSGIVTPQIGPGLELRFGAPKALTYDIQLSYLVSPYDGSTLLIGAADERSNNRDGYYRNLRARLVFELPLRSGRSIMIGVDARALESEGKAEILAGESTPDERQESNFSFTMNTVMAILGIAF